MNGLIALLGSGEYLSVMDEVDKFLLDHCNADERAPRVVCLPTASGREGERSWGRWMRMGEEHFTRLGADVKSLPVIDRDSANDDAYAATVAAADLIYFSGGDPNYLYQTMNGSRVWDAAQKAFARGASYAGCSAGAMILARFMPDFRRAGFGTLPAFGIVPPAFIMPHFDAMSVFRQPLMYALQRQLTDDEFILGIDEETAIIGALGGEWRVHGHKTVSVISRHGKQVHSVGEGVNL
jgi:cyanophycinase-like exopeptidase